MIPAPAPARGLVDALWAVQAGRCFHCGRPMLRGVKDSHELRWSREHLFPKSRYAAAVSACIVLAHRCCNTERGCRHPSGDEVVRARSIYVAAGLPWRIPPPLTAFVGYRPLGNLADLWPASAA